MRQKFFSFLTICFALIVAVPFSAFAEKKFTLVIDAGHGGRDAGAVGRKAKEKTINLNVALAFGKLVETKCPEVKVIYTRKTDKFLSLKNANLFVFSSLNRNFALP